LIPRCYPAPGFRDDRQVQRDLPVRSAAGRAGHVAHNPAAAGAPGVTAAAARGGRRWLPWCRLRTCPVLSVWLGRGDCWLVVVVSVACPSCAACAAGSWRMRRSGAGLSTTWPGLPGGTRLTVADGPPPRRAEAGQEGTRCESGTAPQR